MNEVQSKNKAEWQEKERKTKKKKKKNSGRKLIKFIYFKKGPTLKQSFFHKLFNF